MNLNYFLGVLLAIPCLPLLYFQGKRIKQTIPDLPEANHPQGQVAGNPAHRLRLVILGESTVAGVGVKTHKEGVSGSLARELSAKTTAQIDWKVYAKSGYTAKLVRTKLVPLIKEKQLDLIVIGLGGNDAFHLNPPFRWASEIEQLIKLLQQQFGDTPIAFMNMPPIKTFPAFTPLIKFFVGNLVELLGASLKKVCQRYPNVYFDASILSTEDWPQKHGIKPEPGLFFSDGVHPSKLTYQLWAKDFADFLIQNEILKKKIFLNEST